MNRLMLTCGLAVCLFTCFLTRQAIGDEKNTGSSDNNKTPTCALIYTDDDIPSGSATAGALYVKDADIGRSLLTKDVVAVAKGFFKAGASCVDVIDDHDGAIDPDPLKKINVPVLIPSKSKEPISVHKYKVVALQGFHSNAGVKGFRPHTINDAVKSLEINERTVGEVLMLMIEFGASDVPIGLISGDENAVKEAQMFEPAVEGITVRWLDRSGNTKFLSSEQAGRKLEKAAEISFKKHLKPYKPKTPVEIRLQMSSADAVKGLGPTIGEHFSDSYKNKPSSESDKLKGFSFDNLKISGDFVFWTAPNGNAAATSIYFAVNYLKGSNNWELVGKGYDAFKANKYDEAVKEYNAALKKNPYDVPTKCRIAAALNKQNKPNEAFPFLEYATKRIDEVNGDEMKIWCWIEMAETSEKLGKRDLAKAAAGEIMKLSASKKDFERAKTILKSKQ